MVEFSPPWSPPAFSVELRTGKFRHAPSIWHLLLPLLAHHCFRDLRIALAELAFFLPTGHLLEQSYHGFLDAIVVFLCVVAGKAGRESTQGVVGPRIGAL